MDYNILRQPSECCWMIKKKKTSEIVIFNQYKFNSWNSQK